MTQRCITVFYASACNGGSIDLPLKGTAEFHGSAPPETVQN
ncbi:MULTISPECIES: hypothetical protein [Marinovum]|nr:MULTISPECIES: hypothetical protein [Marinovum]MDD9739553.1 hypothetical protein [Marinovum sp. SP66]MDD9745435.1 hypothetical protein [Marinovum sp. PR37]